MSNPVYFKGSKSVDLVKNSNGEVIYSRNLLINTHSTDMQSVRIGFYSGNLPVKKASFTVSELGVSSGGKLSYGLYCGESTEGFGGGIRLDVDDSMKLLADNSKNSLATGVATISDGAKKVDLYVAKYQNVPVETVYYLPVKHEKLEKLDHVTPYTLAPEDITGTTATTATGGGDFS